MNIFLIIPVERRVAYKRAGMELVDTLLLYFPSSLVLVHAVLHQNIPLRNVTMMWVIAGSIAQYALHYYNKRVCLINTYKSVTSRE